VVPGGKKLIHGREFADRPRHFWGAGGRVNTEITEVGEGMENGKSFRGSLCPHHPL